MALFRRKKKESKVSVIRDLLNCPDDFKFEGEVVDGEIRISIKKKTQVTKNNDIILVNSEGVFSRL